MIDTELAKIFFGRFQISFLPDFLAVKLLYFRQSFKRVKGDVVPIEQITERIEGNSHRMAFVAAEFEIVARNRSIGVGKASHGQKQLLSLSKVVTGERIDYPAASGAFRRGEPDEEFPNRDERRLDCGWQIATKRTNLGE